MNPILAFIIQQLIAKAPELVIDLVQILSKPAPTDAEWEALRAKYRGKTYDDYVPKPPQ